MPCVALLVSCKGKYLARNEGRYHVQRCRALADHVQHDQNMFEMQVSYRQRRHDVGDVCEGR
eukprot:CAMPEP_0179455916 /NCGR_PEP_ID=MMETSP0799-20121207/39766_1 /TAXON_ID=46947 /ORGANISM="Geminigera cryophila, Strain CCMP2564" /LENGTH=61 /DNA_ID=CAMNT_0021255245 /DNA_START=328 /DNA_END=509 /DNA_ORIENTATION=-